MQTIVTAADPIAVASETSRSGVNWAAIFAGAAAAAALSYILVILGFGLGLSSVSPWSNVGANAETIGIATILWLAFTQIIASGMGGYLAGRLRVKWSYFGDDEVYFRDTAHGFLSWAVASLVVIAFLASAVGNVLSSSAGVAGSAISGAGKAVGTSVASAVEESGIDSGYFVDTLFRGNGSVAASAKPTAMSADVDTANSVASETSVQTVPQVTAMESNRRSGSTNRAEVSRIFANAIRTGSLPDADRGYLAQAVAAQTGVTSTEAQQRVDAGFNDLTQGIESAKTAAKEAADAARKAAALLALWLFVSLLCGAFTASLAAIYGGRTRDAASVLALRTVR